MKAVLALLDEVKTHLSRDFNGDYLAVVAERERLTKRTIELLDLVEGIKASDIGAAGEKFEQRQRLEWLKFALESLSLLGRERMWSGLPDEALPELRNIHPGARVNAEVRRLVKQHGLNPEEALAVEIALLARSGLKRWEIGEQFKKEGRKFNECSSRDSLERSVSAYKKKHCDAIEKCGLN